MAANVNLKPVFAAVRAPQVDESTLAQLAVGHEQLATVDLLDLQDPLV